MWRSQRPPFFSHSGFLTPAGQQNDEAKPIITKFARRRIGNSFKTASAFRIFGDITGPLTFGDPEVRRRTQERGGASFPAFSPRGH